MYPKQSLPPARQNVIPTDPPLPSPTRLPAPPCAVAGLRELATGVCHPIPPKTSFAIGRDGTNAIVLLDNTVSRTHAYAQRCHGHLHLIDANSTRGMFIDGRERSSADLYPGGVVRLGSCDLLAMTTAMDAAARDLDRVLGVRDQVNSALLALRETRCLVVTGPVGTSHREIVAALHRATAAPQLPPSVSCEARLPTDEALNALVAKARGGWVLLDATRGVPHLTAATLERLLAPRDEITFVLAMSDGDDVPVLLTPYRPRIVNAVPTAARLRDHSVVNAIDSVLAWRELPLRTLDLHPDLVRAIHRAPWPGNYVQFADVVSFIGRRLSGYKQAAAVAGLYCEAPSTLIRWVHELGVDRRFVGMRPD